jgi:GWxTD domain-containing protein
MRKTCHWGPRFHFPITKTCHWGPRWVVRVLLLVLLVSFAHAADRSKDLPPRYRHWLNEEVNYIIDSTERKQFLVLTTDTQRDQFIDEFWRVRNPDPNSATNSYKDEHYRRLTYANEHYGSAEVQDGWRSDMGHMYIVLGEPKQRMTYPVARNVRPMEIWFYGAENPALPPFFYLLFYKRSIGDQFTLYSPYADGPAKLITGLEALNDQKRAIEQLRKSLGDEVAKISLSLLPSEQVNYDDYTPSLSSDVLLNMIQGLPDNPLTQEQLNQNRLREHVTISVMLGDPGLSLSYDVFRDEEGRQTLSYLLSMSLPDPRIIGDRPDGTSYYDMSLRTSIQTTDGKPVYEQEDELTGNLTAAQADVAKKKKFGAEGRVPLSPGTYVVTATLTNNLNKVGSRQHVTVVVPTVNAKGVKLSGLLAYRAPAAVPDPHGQLPFSVSGLRFTPRGAQSVYIREGDKLPLVFQMWLEPHPADKNQSMGTPDPNATPTANEDKVHLKYVYGVVSAVHDSPTEENDDVDVKNVDKAGNLLTGHTVDTSLLTVGNYRLVVGATRTGTPQTAYAEMTIHVEPPSGFTDAWTAFGPTSGGEAVDDLKRGISAEAVGADADAQKWYMRSLAEHAPDTRPLDKLAALLARRGQTDDLAALSQQPILAQTAASPKTLVTIAGALEKNGNPKGAVKMLDAQIKLQPPSVELYGAMADACQASGDNSRANEMRKLASGVK